jgi:predicted O-linked N-acetylglucosamine transferase (SPINDLY family)
MAAVWHDTERLPDAALAELIRADHIDVLFDLTGHTCHNRLLVFARKPAPLQITWIGYVGTTGLAAMDYLLADRHHVPAEAERHYCEQVLRMPDGYVCFAPPSEAPPVSPLPALASGQITFGSFNQPAKFSATLIATWSALLRALPDARLMLRYRGLGSPLAAERIHRLFATQGIDARRVLLAGGSSRADLLAAYSQIDVALDTFPYSGGLTTCEALWMGVPVVTCPGATFAGRHALSHLSTVGLTETIAGDGQEYVALAVALARDLQRLAALRSTLRARMAASPLCDGPRFARNLMTVLRDAWRRWCEAASRSRPENVH